MPCLVQENPARIGQFDMATRPDQQGNAEFLLKFEDLPAERRLRYMQPRCGLGEMQFFRNSNEIPQMTQVHDDTPKA